MLKLITLAVAAASASAAGSYTYGWTFYVDPLCAVAHPGQAPPSIVPGTCYSQVDYCLAGSTGCGVPNNLGSAGLIAEEVEAGKTLEIFGYWNTAANYAGCMTAKAFAAAGTVNPQCATCSSSLVCPNAFGYNTCPAVCGTSSPYGCAPPSTTAIDCTNANSAGSKCNTATTGNYGAATKLSLGMMAVSSCATFSADFAQASGIGSIKFTAALTAGPIVGIIIGALVVVIGASIGVCFVKKMGPYAPAATWMTFLRSSKAAPSPFSSEPGMVGQVKSPV